MSRPCLLFPSLQFSFFFACYYVNRFVASSLLCVRLLLNSYIVVLYLFDGAEIKDTTALLVDFLSRTVVPDLSLVTEPCQFIMKLIRTPTQKKKAITYADVQFFARNQVKNKMPMHSRIHSKLFTDP